ncbi:MAG: hypothetical protein U0Q11_09395 [Vicinamibacterales bacterium]
MIVFQVALVVSVVLSLGYLAALTMSVVLASLRAGGRLEEAPDSVTALATSRLTIPVSVIVPAGDAQEIGGTIRALLDLNYPEFEVIIVVDGPAASADTVADEWALESVEFFYRRSLDTMAVRRIFRSARDPRLMVVEKDASHPSDALNVGVNIARYRFVAVVPLGTTFGRDALVRAMAPALDDPRNVVGVFSPLEPSGSAVSGRVAGQFLRLRSIRAAMVARLFDGGLSRQVDGDGVRLWRRDAILSAGGFSTHVGCPDLDMAMRLVRDGEQRVVSTPEAFGCAAARVGSAGSADTRDRQLAVLRLLGGVNRLSIRRGLRQGIGATLEAELLTPIAQAWVVVGSVCGAATGIFGWSAVVWCAVILSFGSALVSTSAVLMAGSSVRGPAAAEIAPLLIAAPFEFLMVRPRFARARLSAIFRSHPVP